MKALKDLLESAQNDFQQGQVLLHIVGSLFDTSSATSHLSTKAWNEYVATTSPFLSSHPPQLYLLLGADPRSHCEEPCRGG